MTTEEREEKSAQWRTDNLGKNVVLADVRRRAFSWWDELTSSQKRDYENKTYAAGEWYEDNRLCDEDIVHMYKKWVLHIA